MSAFIEYLLDAIFVVAIVRMVYSALRGFFGPRGASQGPRARPAAAPATGNGGEMARDPECGMFVSTELSHRLRWSGQVLHFCSEQCLQRYQRHSQAS